MDHLKKTDARRLKLLSEVALSLFTDTRFAEPIFADRYEVVTEHVKKARTIEGLRAK